MGLHTANTMKWLRSQDIAADTRASAAGTRHIYQNTASVSNLVYRGYVSLVMDPDSHNIDEHDYPELLVLDIEYIQKARGMFFGQVAQATTLVIIGQRLTEAGVFGASISSCLGRISISPEFLLLGKPASCRGGDWVMDPLLVMCSKHLQDVLSTTETPNKKTFSIEAIVSEVVRETSHTAYPSTPIASSIAQKWLSATLKAGVDIPLCVGAVHHAFSSPEATRDAFCSELLLPKAAVCLARDFHFYALDIVKRAGFNVAVHSERYEKLVSML